VKALVLGGTGFIGGQIARAALAAGFTVRIMRRRHSVGALADIAQHFDWVQGDLEDSASLAAAMDDQHVLFHAAAYYPQRPHETSAQVTYAEAEMGRVLEAAQVAGIERLIYTSSMSTVGPTSEPGRLADERDHYTPGSSDSAYYKVKYRMEQMALQAAEDGLPVVVLLPTAVFGPGDVKPTTGQALLEVARGRVPVYTDFVINVVDGRDVAAAHVAAVQKGRIGERYIIGGHNLSLRDALTMAAETAGVTPPRIKLPFSLVRGLISLAEALPGVALPEHAGTLHLLRPLSTLKAERELGLDPRPFKETTRDTITWFREQGYI
jgi:dihydroflavonol-4-reductase